LTKEKPASIYEEQFFEKTALNFDQRETEHPSTEEIPNMRNSFLKKQL
jgi:hypothetical protein